MLNDDPDDQFVGVGQRLQRRGADVLQICPGLLRLPDGKFRALGAPLHERVVALRVLWLMGIDRHLKEGAASAA